MSDKQEQPPAVDPYAPLVWLVRRLHEGTTLRELVVKHRWRRKRPTTVVAAAASEGETTKQD